MEFLKTIFSAIFLLGFPSVCCLVVYVIVEFLLSVCLGDGFKWRACVREGSDYISKVLLVILWVLFMYVGMYLLDPELYNEIMLSIQV